MWLVCYCSDVDFSFPSLTRRKIEGDEEKTSKTYKKRFVNTIEEKENEVRTDYFIE